MPSDGGGAPAKPVFSQKISFVSGANPPAVGSTTRIRVELVIFNPAAQDITFSAANTVTSYVPGNGVVYAGNPVASQWNVQLTPAIGGTGTVTWNPGTVAGNNTYATLYYEVNVTPPSNARMPRYRNSGRKRHHCPLRRRNRQHDQRPPTPTAPYANWP